MDIKKVTFFLGATAAVSPYGVLWNQAGQAPNLAIEDVNDNMVFPQGYVDIRDIEIPNGYESYIAEVGATPTVAEPTNPLIANTVYGFWIEEYSTATNSWGTPYKVSYNTGTGPVAQNTAAAKWVVGINLLAANGNLHCTAAAVAGTLTITAGAGYPLLRVYTPLGAVVITPSAGTVSVGAAIDLSAQGYTAGANPQQYIATSTYDRVQFFYDVPLAGALAGSRKQRYQVILYIDNTAANVHYAAWKAYFLSVAQGTIAGFAIAASKVIH